MQRYKRCIHGDIDIILTSYPAQTVIKYNGSQPHTCFFMRGLMPTYYFVLVPHWWVATMLNKNINTLWICEVNELWTKSIEPSG